MVAIAFVACAGVLTLGTSAWAAGGETNGAGHLHSGGTYGFNAKSNLKGEMQFESADGTVKVHCTDLQGYREKTNSKGFLDAVFKSVTCTNGWSVWVDAQDRGEPGTNDKVHVRVTDANGNVIGEDQGVIMNGDVQIHP
jgi:hypothetical protein